MKDIFKKMWKILKPVGIFIIKKNNPSYSVLIDSVISGKIENYKSFNKVSEVVTTTIDLKAPKKPNTSTLEKQSGNDVWEEFVLSSGVYGTLNGRYFSEADIKNSTVDISVDKNANPKDFVFKCKDFKKGKEGFFPVCITHDNHVWRGGHAGHCRSTGFQHEIDCNMIPKTIFKDMKYFFVVRTHHEGNPRGIISRSNIVEVK